MAELRYTLIADGSSDVAIVPIINWLLNDLYPELPTIGSFADFRHLPEPPGKGEIALQIEHALRYYPFDILFYHRDAELSQNNIIELRKNEVLEGVGSTIEKDRIVCIVPIRMMEAWLLIDAAAIKKAAENRNYSGTLILPSSQKLEQLPDPKKALFDLLKIASGKKKRNLEKFNVHKARHLVAEFITDFSPLRSLSSFVAFETSVKQAIERWLVVQPA